MVDLALVSGTEDYGAFKKVFSANLYMSYLLYSLFKISQTDESFLYVQEPKEERFLIFWGEVTKINYLHIFINLFVFIILKKSKKVGRFLSPSLPLEV